MLLKNISTDTGLVNGSRGVVIGYEEEKENQEWIKIQPDRKWPRVRFTNGLETTIYPDKWQIEQGGKVLATRQQVPLLLAWALTVHKAQGMTLDRVELNLHGVFEYGQGLSDNWFLHT
jgi:ATP-dependent DNA helicase PIF1